MDVTTRNETKMKQTRNGCNKLGMNVTTAEETRKRGRENNTRTPPSVTYKTSSKWVMHTYTLNSKPG